MNKFYFRKDETNGSKRTVLCRHHGITTRSDRLLQSCDCKLSEWRKTRFIVDCGLFQESDYSQYNASFPFNAENIEFCVVTHNHVDHTGRLPLLVKKGFTGEIYTSKATAILLPLALADSYKVLRMLQSVITPSNCIRSRMLQKH